MSFVLPRRHLLAQLPAGARYVSAPPSQPLARPSSKKHRVKPAKKPSDELPLQALQAIGQSKPTALAGRLKVVSLASCDSFDLAALLQGLKAAQLLPGALNLVGSAIYIPRYSVAAAKVEGDGMEESPETGELFIFEGGSIVGWGFPSPRGVETFLRKVIRGGDSSSGTSPFIEKGRALETEMEVLSYVVDPSAPYQMLGDIISLTHPPLPPPPIGDSDALPPDLLARLAFSAGIARATTLSLYENKFESFADGVAGIPAALEAGSSSPVRRNDIGMRLGHLHGLRQALNLDDSNLLDSPDFLWDNPGLSSLYDSVCEALEFEQRMRTINQRIEYAFSLQQTLIDLLSTRASRRLELLIAALIAGQVSFVLYWEGVFTRGGKGKEVAT